MNFKRHLYLVFGLAVCLWLFAPQSARAAEGVIDLMIDQNGNSVQTDDGDAIAVRVLPNPNHYSAARWYKSQGFSGSPQALLVDGYDAVRDGRTVYVNAANVDEASHLIYTNIYLISYNQNPNFKTIDVLGQIVDHWRFNSNLNTPGHCYISTLTCQNDTDCTDGQTCFGKSTAPGRCRPANNDVCYTDADCGAGIYCDSLRAKIARDVRRLGILGDLRESLSAFKQANSKYPVLGAGTYLPLTSLSVWPSWQSSFLPKLGSAQSLVDPINMLGPCAEHDAVTCWNENTNSFADPEVGNNTLELPGGSYAFVYSSDSNGSNYSLCAAMESKSLGYNTTEGQLADSGCVASGAGYTGSSNNLPPVLISANLQGEQGQAFSGFIKVLDPEGNPLNWNINTAGATWSNWSAAPIMQDTANPNQKKLYAAAAGNTGTYNVSLTVTDGQGGTLATVTPIKINNGAPTIQSDDVIYYPSTVIPLTIRFNITDKHHPVTYTLTKATWNSGPYDLLSPGNATFMGATSNRVGDTVYYTLKYNLHTTNKFTTDTTFVYVITAKDAYNTTATRQVNLVIKVDPPILDFNCAKAVRVGASYYCGLGWQKQGDHTITYSAVGLLPTGLVISGSEGAIEDDLGNNAQARLKPWHRLMSWLEGAFKPAKAAVMMLYYSLNGTPTTASSSLLVKIKAENEFGAVSQREFNLAVNTYCGDGARQTPNLEGRGGFYNDGHEDCDGNAGIAVNRSQIGVSSINLQYGCTNKVGEAVPYPIMNNQYFCVYLSSEAEDGGGYCGDGYCQAKIKRNGVLVPWEIDGYCPADCTCAGVNQVQEGNACICAEGWFDCETETPGCETNHACDILPDGGTGGGGSVFDGCAQDEYLCGGECYSRTSQFSCGANSNKCYNYQGSTCTTSCESGMYNCDGRYDCEASSCSCPLGSHWNSAAWPNAQCVSDSQEGCPNGQLPCGEECYNPNSQKCCPPVNICSITFGCDDEADTVCNLNQSCCYVQGVANCANNAAMCQYLQNQASGNNAN